MAYERLIRNSTELAQTLLWASQLIDQGLPGGPVMLTIKRPPRSLSQNAKMWCLLKDISEQVEWDGQYLNMDEWKDLLSAAYRKQRAVLGIDGGVVFLGLHTSALNREEFSELIEQIYAFGTDKEIQWSEESRRFYGSIKHKAAPVCATDSAPAYGQGKAASN